MAPSSSPSLDRTSYRRKTACRSAILGSARFAAMASSRWIFRRVLASVILGTPRLALEPERTERESDGLFRK